MAIRLVLLSAFLFSLLSAPLLAAEDLLGEAAFTKRFIATVEALEPGSTATEKGRLEVEATKATGDRRKAYLDNAYLSYRRSPGDIDAILRLYARNLVAVTPDKRDESRPLLPVLRNKDMFSTIPTTEQGRQPVMMPLAGDISICFVYDEPERVSYLVSGDVDSSGKTPAELLRQSVGMLETDMPQYDYEDAGVLALVGGGMYTTSLILSERFWADFPVKFRGDPVVVLIDRQTFVVTGSGEPKGLQVSQQLARNIAEGSPYIISITPILRRNGTWSVYSQ